MPTETPVIVNQEHLQDIADAIRAKNGSIDTYTPAQMAAAISALETGGGGISFDALGAAITNAGSMPTPSSGYFQWNGDIRKYLCIIQLGTGSYNGGTFNRGYMYFLNDLYNTSNYVTWNNQQYVPVRQLASSVTSGNTYFYVYTGYMVPLSSLTNSYNKPDSQSFSAQIMNTSGSGVVSQNRLYQWGLKIPDIII